MKMLEEAQVWGGGDKKELFSDSVLRYVFTLPGVPPPKVELNKHKLPGRLEPTCVKWALIEMTQFPVYSSEGL